MIDEMEVLRLKLINTQLQAQSLERDVIVLNYARLLQEAQGLQQEISKIEEEVRRDEETRIEKEFDGLTGSADPNAQ